MAISDPKLYNWNNHEKCNFSFEILLNYFCFIIYLSCTVWVTKYKTRLKLVTAENGDSGVFLCRSRTYDLPITSSHATPLSYRGWSEKSEYRSFRHRVDPIGSLSTRVFERADGNRKRNISCARTVVSPRFFILIISNGEKILSNVNVLCKDKLKEKTAHFRLPSGSQKRASLSSLIRRAERPVFHSDKGGTLETSGSHVSYCGYLTVVDSFGKTNFSIVIGKRSYVRKFDFPLIDCKLL